MTLVPLGGNLYKVDSDVTVFDCLAPPPNCDAYGVRANLCVSETVGTIVIILDFFDGCTECDLVIGEFIGTSYEGVVHVTHECAALLLL